LHSANFFRIKPWLYLIVWASGFAPASIVFSSETRPLYSFNQSPLIQIYGLPSLGEAKVLAPGESDLALRLQIANNFTGAQSASEYLNLDGETHRLTLSWRQGLANGTEWGFELPYISHNGGFLDRPIETFHNTFNLPQGGRTAVARNQINYRYIRDGVDLINVTHSVNGTGDLRLNAAKQIEDHESSDGDVTALRMSLKLPTGDTSELLGSGSTDLAIWVSTATTHPSSDWNLYGGGGILLLSEGKVLPLQQRNQIGFGTFGLSRTFFPHLSFNGQLNAHSSFYDHTHFRQLNSFAVQGLAGLNWECSPRKFLEFSVSEDLIVNTSPDVVFTLSLNFLF
jgi:hypothetical protein